MNPLLDEAERLAGLGVCAIPVRAGSKASACKWARFSAPPDASERRRLFERAGGVAVVLGAPSGGLAARDFDAPGAFEAWASREPALAAELPTVRTARGAHVYFRADGLDGVRSYSNGELRLGRCYTLIPPSVHPGGMPYEWLRRLDALPRMLDPFEAGLACDTANTANTANTSHRGGGEPASAQRCAAPAIPPETLRGMILRTLPERAGQRNARLWKFAREVRVILPGDAEALMLKPIARAWFDEARPIIGTRDWSETWADFERAFRRVAVPADADALRLAAERAAVAEPPAALAEFADTEGLLRLACVCRELSRLSGGRFFLSARAAAEAMGTDRMTACRWLRLLCVEGVLERLHAGTKGPGGKAAEFRWIGGDD